MGKYIFAFPSVTIALKAQQALTDSGFQSRIIRTPKNLSAGCGYSLVSTCEVETVSAIFERSGIVPKAVSKL